MQQRTRLSLLNTYEEDELWFLYQTRLLPEVDKNLSGNPPPSFKKHIDFLDNNFPRKRLIYLIKDEYIKGLFYGYCQVYNLDQDDKTLEVGWVIHPRFQGKGLGKSSVSLLLEEVKREFPSYYKVKLIVRIDNFVARHIYEKMGFKDVGQDETNIEMEKNNE